MAAPLSIVPTPTRIHKHWLHSYVAHNEDSESPPYIHFWTGVSTIAGALRRRVWLPQGRFDWTPNFYILFVAPAGIVGKSTAIDTGLQLLEQVLPEKHFGPQSTTWQALAEKMRLAEETIHVPGAAKPQTMSCLTLSVGELGNLIRPDNGELVDMLIPMWDSQRRTWRRSTKTQGSIEIRTPCLNLISATTPDWLEANFTKQVLNGGLGSRVIFIYAEEKAKMVAYPALLTPPAHRARMEEELVHDLARISELAGEFQLTPEACELGKIWYDEHWTHSSDPGRKFEGYRARKQTHIHKLVMVISVSKRDDLVGTEDDMKEAIAHITALERQMGKVYDSVGVPPSVKAANTVRDILLQVKQIHTKDLCTLCSALEPRHYADAINRLIHAGLVRRTAAEGGGSILTYIGKA